MRKVLVIFPFKHQFPFVEGKCKFLLSHDINVDAFLLEKTRMEVFTLGNKSIPFIISLSKIICAILNYIPRFLRQKTISFISPWVLKRLIAHYDIVELAGVYSMNRLKIAELVKSKGKRINVAIWGTDFYGIQDYENDWHKNLFQIADAITVGSKKMETDVSKAYPKYKEKILLKVDGLNQLETLKELIDGKIKKDISFLDKRAEGKIKMAIGYSARTWQQHFYVLDALEKISNANKQKLFLIIPMTYDLNHEYKDYLKSRLLKLGIPFQILENRLPLIQNLSMRQAADISICIQNTDGLAASVREYIMAGSVFIGGDWLPYKIFLDEGMYLRLTSLADLSDNITDVIENLQKEKEKCKKNGDLMYNFSSWNRKGDDYLEIYR